MSLDSIRRNRLVTRAELERLLRDLIAPLSAHFTPGRAGLRLGATQAWYGSPGVLLEAFARPLWGLIPLAAGGGRDDQLWSQWREGLVHGTDPDHPEFWGWTQDFDHGLVETTILALGIVMAPDVFWSPLAATEQARVLDWIARATTAQPFDNNWRFFRVIANAVLRRLGNDFSAETLEADLRRLDEFYLGEGWYADGDGRRGDYYGPWAMHFYGLIYSRVAREADPSRSAEFCDRAKRFAVDFIHWFAADGAAVPFGRSLTYRMAQGSFWGALPFAGVEALPWGVVKGLYLRHLRWWMNQPIFSESGLLGIGYQYPNLTMAEAYNGPGSPYWAFKIFLPLALPAGHPFWNEPEMPMPQRHPVVTMPWAGQVLTIDPTGLDVVALNAGQPISGIPRHAAQKYSKFAYSTRFAFSIAAGASDALAEGGFDSVLALSDDGTRFRPRDHCLDVRTRDGVAYSCWRPWPDVEVRTWLVAFGSVHLRVHRLKTARALWSAETGFAAGYENRAQVAVSSPLPGAIAVQTGSGGSGLHNLGAARTGERIFLEPNTNLARPLAAMPVLRSEHPPGEFWLVCVAGGWSGPVEPFAAECRSFSADWSAGRLAILRGDAPVWHGEA